MFNITDLMVNLASQGGAGAQPQIFCVATCRVCTGTCYDTCYGSCAYSWGCGRSYCSLCGESTVIQVQAAGGGDPAAQLSALKEHLQLTIQQIEKQEQQLAKNK